MGADKRTYIHQLKSWPSFIWDHSKLSEKLAEAGLRQGRLIGQMGSLGFQLRSQATLTSLTEEILKSNEIEGEKLDRETVRSSLAKRLGIDIGGLSKSDRSVDGVVEMTLDATQMCFDPLSADRLFGWHSAIFPSGRSGLNKIRVGKWRNDGYGPMQVISGPAGKTKIHFEAPSAENLPQEIRSFFNWFNSKKQRDSILKAAIAHLWFITIHPFDDGNGRIARAITDMVLARAEESPQRFYSMSAQILLMRNSYYDILEKTQTGNLDITEWLLWFLDCLNKAISGAESTLQSVLQKNHFWETHGEDDLNHRQRKILNLLLDDFKGSLTSSKWAILAKCSQDTASRDIEDLIKRKILIKNTGGGRSTSYSLRAPIDKVRPS